MERNDKAAIEALLKRHGFHFSKSMGQNFLIDPAIPYEIAESSRANEQNGVLEIGPGIGALSHELCERAGKVVARWSSTRRCCRSWTRPWRALTTSRSCPPIF